MKKTKDFLFIGEKSEKPKWVRKISSLLLISPIIILGLVYFEKINDSWIWLSIGCSFIEIVISMIYIIHRSKKSKSNLSE